MTVTASTGHGAARSKSHFAMNFWSTVLYYSFRQQIYIKKASSGIHNFLLGHVNSVRRQLRSHN